MSLKTIIVGGYAVTGASVACDLLEEVDLCRVVDSEFRLITDPDGLISLDHALSRDWTPYRADKAIKRFRALCDCLTRPTLGRYRGVNLTRAMGPEVRDLLRAFTEAIVDVRYSGRWTGTDGLWPQYSSALNRLWKADIVPTRSTVEIGRCSSEEFGRMVQKLFQNIRDSMRVDEDGVMVFDEGYASLQMGRVLTYFGPTSKFVVVDRDPRDVYLNIVKRWKRFAPRNAAEFCPWYRTIREAAADQPPAPDADGRVTRVMFEDLVLGYPDTAIELLEFLHPRLVDHWDRGGHFDPARSRANVGTWSRVSDPQLLGDVRYIEKELEPYLHESRFS